MATLTVSDIVSTGLTDALVAANSGGDDFVASDDQRYFLEIANGGGSSITVTIAGQVSQSEQAGVGPVSVSSIAVAVAASARKKIGPITRAYIRQDGKVQITYSAVSSVTVGAFRLPRAAA
jgi:hypothetical protein